MGDIAGAEESRAIGELLRRFLAHLRRRSPSTTADTYRARLDPLCRWLEGRGVVLVDQLTEQLLEEWQDSLVDRGLRPKSRALSATAVRSWIRWLMERELADWRLLRAVTSVRVPRARAHPIPREDLVQLLAALGPRAPGMTLRELRDRALWFYALATGARVSELLQVRRQGYHDQSVVQKGGSERRLRIPPTVRQMVQEYLDGRTDDVHWLWVTLERGRPPRRMTRAAANMAWRRMAARLGVQRWTTHRLRDSSATFLALRRFPTHLIADHLGHANLQTVGKYIQVAEEQRGDVLEVMEEWVQEAPRGPRREWVRLRGRPDRRPMR